MKVTLRELNAVINLLKDFPGTLDLREKLLSLIDVCLKQKKQEVDLKDIDITSLVKAAATLNEAHNKKQISDKDYNELAAELKECLCK